MAAKTASRPTSEPDWSQSYQPPRMPERRSRQKVSRCRRRHRDPAHRRSGSPGSYRRRNAGEEPETRTSHIGGGGVRPGAARAAEIVAPDAATEAHKRVASTAAGADGEITSI